ncbi:MAG: hypothetical protein HOP37_00105 [Cyclobacteriaceae bacterium]|nr:hypothetical protein [Cyclobacteriaceae bacterium]
MEREKLLKKTIEGLTNLSDPKLLEASNFVDFLLGQLENRILTEGIQNRIAGSKSFSFLEEEKTIYQITDLKERYK